MTNQNSKLSLNILVTGGCGFMGRWVCKNLLEKGHEVWILDNLSNCAEENIKEFSNKLSGFIKDDIKDKNTLSQAFKNNFDICIHMAAAINVQESIDNPRKCFDDNVLGTFLLLEECRKAKTKMVFISSALIYQTPKNKEEIAETHPLNPSCPYTASKIFGEEMTIAYHKTYDLPCVILRPFSIYGPWQRNDSEGGVMSIFIDRKLKEKPLEVFGSGNQSRDFFYVEDCADFIVKASLSDSAVGEIFNAGSGNEVRIKDLADSISEDAVSVKFVEHHHLHAEIMHMRASSDKAKKVLGWQAKVGLKEGIEKTTQWLKQRI
ncbi:MAG: SDR family NAD(P)-dependent oxidoreductase [Candidatus Omnitrophota bacterium]